MVTLFAISPFLILLVLMAVFNRPAYVAAPVTALWLSIGGYYIWGMPLNWLAAAFVRGSGVTLEIMLIIFGAIFLVAILRQLNFFEPMQSLFANISQDKRIQAIMVSWFFVGFIEGIAGFGTPALLAIPILLALGFTPLIAVVLALVGDSIVVVFGAVGVPISIGIAEGVGVEEGALLAAQVSSGASLLNLLLGAIIPLFISAIVSYEYTKSIKRGFEVWRFVVVSSFAFMVPSFAAAYWLGPEFPSVIGAFCGGSLMVYLLHKGLLQPRTQITDINYERKKINYAQVAKIFLPYLIVIILLLITRLPALGLGEYLKSWAWQTSNLFTTDVSFVFNWAYSPGLIFLISAIASWIIYRGEYIDLVKAFKESAQRITMPLFGLLFVLYIVQILLLSYYNNFGLPSIPLLLAEKLEIVGLAWPLVAPFVGVVGAFIAGSSTVSNLLFSSLQYTTATTIGISAVLVLSLQAVGSALGNMVAVHNILAAEAVAGLKNMEGKILRRTLIPVAIYGSMLGIVGLIISYFN